MKIKRLKKGFIWKNFLQLFWVPISIYGNLIKLIAMIRVSSIFKLILRDLFDGDLREGQKI